jgi:hypothetical protein
MHAEHVGKLFLTQALRPSPRPKVAADNFLEIANHGDLKPSRTATNRSTTYKWQTLRVHSHKLPVNNCLAHLDCR